MFNEGLWEDPLEKEMALYSSIVAWEITWTEEPGGLQSTGLKSRTQWSHQPTTAEGLPMGPWPDRVAVLLRRDSRSSLSLSGFLFTPRKDHARHSEGGCHLQARKSSHQKPINESLDLGLLAPRTVRKSKLRGLGRSVHAVCCASLNRLVPWASVHCPLPQMKTAQGRD